METLYEIHAGAYVATLTRAPEAPTQTFLDFFGANRFRFRQFKHWSARFRAVLAQKKCSGPRKKCNTHCSLVDEVANCSELQGPGSTPLPSRNSRGRVRSTSRGRKKKRLKLAARRAKEVAVCLSRVPFALLDSRPTSRVTEELKARLTLPRYCRGHGRVSIEISFTRFVCDCLAVVTVILNVKK